MTDDSVNDVHKIAEVIQKRWQQDLEKGEAAKSGGVLPEFAKGLFTGIIFLATFGGSITFQTIIQDLGTKQDDNPGHRFSRKRARTFLAISWVLFTIDLGLSAILVAMLYLYKGEQRKSWADKLFVRLISFILLPGVLVGALLFSSLAITAYSEPTGWTAVGFCGLFAFAILLWWCIEVA